MGAEARAPLGELCDQRIALAARRLVVKLERARVEQGLDKVVAGAQPTRLLCGQATMVVDEELLHAASEVCAEELDGGGAPRP